MHFTGNPGPTGDFATLSAVEFVKLYCCQLVWDMLVDETNRHAKQTIDSNPDQQFSWHPTNVPEMMAFVALLIAIFFISHSIRPSCPVIGSVQFFGSSTSPITKTLKFCSVHAKKTHQTGYESLLPERVQNKLHMRVETVYRS